MEHSKAVEAVVVLLEGKDWKNEEDLETVKVLGAEKALVVQKNLVEETVRGAEMDFVVGTVSVAEKDLAAEMGLEKGMHTEEGRVLVPGIVLEAEKVLEVERVLVTEKDISIEMSLMEETDTMIGMVMVVGKDSVEDVTNLRDVQVSEDVRILVVDLILAKKGLDPETVMAVTGALVWEIVMIDTCAMSHGEVKAMVDEDTEAVAEQAVALEADSATAEKIMTRVKVCDPYSNVVKCFLSDS